MINVIVIIQSPVVNLYEPIYRWINDESNKKEICVQFVLIPFGDPKNNPEFSMHDLTTFFSQKKLPFLIGYENEKFIDPLSFNPDLIFFQTPYDDYRASDLYNSGRLSKKVPIAHISYGASLIQYTGIYSGLIEMK